MQSLESMLLSIAIMHAPSAMGTPMVSISRTILPVESTCPSSACRSPSPTMPEEYGAESRS